MFVEYGERCQKTGKACLVYMGEKSKKMRFNYRGVSLLNVTNKVYEQILMEKLKVQQRSRLKRNNAASLIFRNESNKTLPKPYMSLYESLNHIFG